MTVPMQQHSVGVLPREDNTHLDERDRVAYLAIGRAFAATMNASPALPVVGEQIILANGARAVAAHVWNWDGDPLTLASVQPSRGGSIHINQDGHGSYSGSLDQGIRQPFLELTGDTAAGTFWMWHHGRAGAGNGVDITLTVRVWRVNVDAARAVIAQHPEPPTICHAHRHPTYDKHDDTCRTHQTLALHNAARRVIDSMGD